MRIIVHNTRAIRSALHFAIAQRTTEAYTSLRDELATCRREHEEADKRSEMELETTLLEMRRAADKDVLQANQNHAMMLLSRIQAGYRDFYRGSLDCIHRVSIGTSHV